MLEVTTRQLRYPDILFVQVETSNGLFHMNQSHISVQSWWCPKIVTETLLAGQSRILTLFDPTLTPKLECIVSELPAVG